MKQVYNPYLPLTEYVPDGEPHVFGDRVYIYGSHDKAGGTVYCEGDYVTYSAAINDLASWKYEGVIYRTDQDPSNADRSKQLWAPDVTQGPDRRYYMYYCFNFHNEIGVAVSDSPAGPFAFYDHVHYPPNILGGKVLQEYMPFDPAVLTDDDGRVYLYYGFAPACEKEMLLPEFSEEELAAMPESKRREYEGLRDIIWGEDSMVVELESDMLTTKGEPKVLIPGGNHTHGTGFEGHGFFEASSIRKFGDTYYFVYSSHKSHELCYATSDKPDADFSFGGTIVSNGDVGLEGRKQPVNVLGNNHGGIEKIGQDYYIFYHRQTNGTEFSRQGCAEKIEIKPDGSIRQTEITSCGLNRGPLAASGAYPAAIACHITSASTQSSINYGNPVMKTQTRITERDHVAYVTDIADGSIVGYKYFTFDHVEKILLELRGSFAGEIEIATDLNSTSTVSREKVSLDTEYWKIVEFACEINGPQLPVYFKFYGKGKLDLRTILFM